MINKKREGLFFLRGKDEGSIIENSASKRSRYDDCLDERQLQLAGELEELELMFKLHHGIMMRRDGDKAKQICLKHSEKGNLIAMGFKYLNDWEMECEDFEDIVEVMEDYHDVLKQSLQDDYGDQRYVHNTRTLLGHCLYLLGCFYFEGVGTEKDHQIAKALFEEAIILGNTLSIFNLGLLYNYGEGIEKNKEKAFEFYVRASDKGYFHSTFCVGFSYQCGDGVEVDVEKAFEYYEKAAGYGEINSMIKFAKIYEKGKGRYTKNLQKAFSYHYEAYLYYKHNGDEEYGEKHKKKLKLLTESGEIEWTEEQHFLWKVSDKLMKSIVNLLLISKFRRESKKKSSSILIKGLVIKIIKYLCQT